MRVDTLSTPLGLAMGSESWVFTEGLWCPNILTYWPHCTCWATDSEQVLKLVKVLYKISSPLSREKSHLILKGADCQTSSRSATIISYSVLLSFPKLGPTSQATDTRECPHEVPLTPSPHPTPSAQPCSFFLCPTGNTGP